jgi:hypothetical protein
MTVSIINPLYKEKDLFTTYGEEPFSERSERDGIRTHGENHHFVRLIISGF